jgi:hypothetical protein
MYPALLLAILAVSLTACHKQPDVFDNTPAPSQTADSSQPLPPEANAVPVTPQVISDDGDVQATLTRLTRELHRAMAGRRLSGSWDEFVAVRNLQVPPPPAGKRYAISKQWKVVLVDTK